jgi:DNA-binding NarL/FixJ family response regulator
MQEAIRIIEDSDPESEVANDARTSARGTPSPMWSLVDDFVVNRRRYVVWREDVPQSSAPRPLTPKERLVVDYAQQGLSTKETAFALSVCDATVRVLMMRAARKFGVRTRKELLAFTGNGVARKSG